MTWNSETYTAGYNAGAKKEAFDPDLSGDWRCGYRDGQAYAEWAERLQREFAGTREKP